MSCSQPALCKVNSLIRNSQLEQGADYSVSTHAAVIPLALHVLKIAAQICLVCSRPGGMRTAGPLPALRPSELLGRGPACAREDSRAQGEAQLCSLSLSALEKLREGSALLGSCAVSGKAQGRARLGLGQEVVL